MNLGPNSKAMGRLSENPSGFRNARAEISQIPAPNTRKMGRVWASLIVILIVKNIAGVDLYSSI